jgi:hypothetical protein
MTAYHVLGLDDTITGEVRSTMRSPQYGHPATLEVAAGTGPCRACLEPFRVGEEERVLFTFRPDAGTGSLAAPGPVFIHARTCERYRGTRFPPALSDFELIAEARAGGNRVPVAREVRGAHVEAIIEMLLADADVEYVNVRHAKAGCHVARVSRGPLPVPAKRLAVAPRRRTTPSPLTVCGQPPDRLPRLPTFP